jgi:hypothetical protein
MGKAELFRDDDFIAKVLDSAAEIDVFEIEEEVFIESAETGE